MTESPATIPQAFYRVQLHKGFAFSDLEKLLQYFTNLGITDIYASPLFTATPGSTHGYDVNDPNQINPELGGMDGLRKLSKIMSERGLGLMQDFVPNHMGIAGMGNWRWRDVLENGRSSRYANHFDIEWNPREASLSNRILVPILHDFYGRVLESGDIQMRYGVGVFWIDYKGQFFPICCESYGRIVDRLAPQYEPGTLACIRLEELSREFRILARVEITAGLDETHLKRREILRNELADLITAEKLDAGLSRTLRNINGTMGQPASFDTLHDILEEQNYRLAYWKLAAHEINYRRFFAIDTLIGLKVENKAVFDDCHELVQQLLGEGIITGLRIDHIDGLWDPTEYLDRLRFLAIQEGLAPYVVVEKILCEDEELPEDWPVHGTTGYEFAGALINVLTDHETESDLNRIYQNFTGHSGNPNEAMYELKRYVMEELFPNSLDNLAASLAFRVKSDRLWRDLTVNELRDALKNIIASLSIYRTYRRHAKPIQARDIKFIDEAVNGALARNTTQDHVPYEFIRSVWTGALKLHHEQAWEDDWVCKLQQITGAIMAKSVEDTFFYRYVRLLASNEVGHDPRILGRSVAAFHQTNQRRLETQPHCLLTTSTHDTKMSEDARARLMVISEIPDEWEFLLNHWKFLNASHKTQVDGRMAPDGNEEYLLYQALLGAWPLGEAVPTPEFVQRIKDYFHKAISEAKQNTNWNYPNEAWAKACSRFIEEILVPDPSNPFLQSFLPFLDKVSTTGMVNSLAQVTLKLTCPGIPDVYQGNELWAFDLVDPDNRRPVDYQLREKLIQSLDQADPVELLDTWTTGRIKMFVTQRLLKLRIENRDLFAKGSYTALTAHGPFGDHCVAFLRVCESASLLVLVPRITHQLGAPPTGKLWQETELEIPGASNIPWTNVLTGESFVQSDPHTSVAHLLEKLPVGVWFRKNI